MLTDVLYKRPILLRLGAYLKHLLRVVFPLFTNAFVLASLRLADVRDIPVAGSEIRQACLLSNN